MSPKNAHPSKLVTPKDSQVPALTEWPVGNPHAFEEDSPSATRGFPPRSSGLRPTPDISPRPRTPLPSSPALKYLGMSATRLQYQRPEPALNSTGGLSKNDRNIVQQIQNFNTAAGGISRPMTASPFSNFSSIPDLLANVERTLEPSIDPLQRPGDIEEKSALSSASLELNDAGLSVDPSQSTQSARDKAPEKPRQRGLSVADINLLNAAYEENGGGKERHAGSSIVTLDSRGQIRRGGKFDDKLETRSVFHGAGEREGSHVEDDDKSIELAGGIYYHGKGDGNETCYGDKTSEETENEEARLQPDIGMSVPQGSSLGFAGLWPGVHAYDLSGASSMHDVSASSTRRVAMGLAKELRRLSLAPEDLVIPSNPAVDTVDPDLGPDMVGGLPAWEFKRAGLDRFLSSKEVEQQETILEAFEQGFGPEVLEGSNLEKGSDSENGGHLFVFGRVQPRTAASAVASGSGVGIRRANVSNRELACVVLQSEEGLEDEKEEEEEEEEEAEGEGEGGEGGEGEGEGGEGGEEGEEREEREERGAEEELTLEEQEQIDRAMAMSLEDLKHEPIGKGKGKAD